MEYFTGHTQPSPKIWFETEHFEILSFRASGSDLVCSPLELEMTLESNSHGFLKFSKFNWNPFEEMNKTQKSFRKWRRLIFNPNLLGN